MRKKYFTEADLKAAKALAGKRDREKHKERRYATARRWLAAHPDAGRFYIIKCLYGLSRSEWESLFESQGRRCAICRSESPGGRGSWHVDHSHATGKVRGLLCAICNMQIVKAIESPHFNAAMAYLAR